MTWHNQMLDASVNELVERNSPELLAMHVQEACREYLDVLEDHKQSIRTQHASRTGGQLVLAQLNRLKTDGRKTARVDDLIAEAKRGYNEEGVPQ